MESSSDGQIETFDEWLVLEVSISREAPYVCPHCNITNTTSRTSNNCFTIATCSDCKMVFRLDSRL